jgi:multidrug efflux pump subunit AcrA (membrane-fusion protein)
VELALDDVQARALPSGLTVKVTFTRSEPALSVPLLALVDGDGDHAAVFVLKDGHAQRSKVRIDYLEGERAALLEGPPVDTRVVTAGAGDLRDGARVRVVSEE